MHGFRPLEGTYFATPRVSNRVIDDENLAGRGTDDLNVTRRRSCGGEVAFLSTGFLACSSGLMYFVMNLWWAYSSVETNLDRSSPFPMAELILHDEDKMSIRRLPPCERSINSSSKER